MQKKRNDSGSFVISLDFELRWGVWDVTTKENYSDHILGVRKVIPVLLNLFDQFGIKTTFATVGFLFAKNKDELLSYLPQKKPAYSNSNYDVYSKELGLIGTDETDDPWHFGYSLLELIKNSPHELATHTFCHYYCMEEGQTDSEFNADLNAAIKIATAKNIQLTSIVFPRNQLNVDYLNVLKENGIKTYRGNPSSWIYKPREFTAEIILIRFLRLLDTYIPISGYNSHVIKREKNMPVNIPASRFLKPYNKNLAWLEKFKLLRIKNEMTKAAQRGEVFHLWWHPHNFGINIEENISNLTTILEHFNHLKQRYGFENHTMHDIGSNNVTYP